MIKIIIADDHVLFIDGLKLLLETEDDIRVLDVVNNGRELLDILPGHTANIIMLDINMPKLNGLETVRYIKQSHPSLKTIMLSTYSDNHLIEKAKAHGANGYLLKTTNKQELLQTIRLVYSGHACFPYQQPSSLNEFDGNDPFLKKFNLTRRETEILHLIKENYTNQRIADKLFLSVYTVETHRKNIMQKLGLKSPALLMRFILENNI